MLYLSSAHTRSVVSGKLASTSLHYTAYYGKSIKPFKHICVRSHQNDAHVGSYVFLIWTSWNNLRNAGMPLQYCTSICGVPVYKAIPFIDSSGLSFVISKFPAQIRNINKDINKAINK